MGIGGLREAEREGSFLGQGVLSFDFSLLDG